jgi:hypothetical protein
MVLVVIDKWNPNCRYASAMKDTPALKHRRFEFPELEGNQVSGKISNICISRKK